MIYANSLDVTDYTGIDEADLPSDIERLLERASELIDYVTLDAIDTTDTDQLEAAKKAVCAQVHDWILNGEETIAESTAIKSKTVGKTSITFTENNQAGRGTFNDLAPRARRHLQREGLLYRGAGLK